MNIARKLVATGIAVTGATSLYVTLLFVIVLVEKAF